MNYILVYKVGESLLLKMYIDLGKRDVYSFSSNDSPVKAFVIPESSLTVSYLQNSGKDEPDGTPNDKSSSAIPVVSISANEDEVKLKEKPQGSSVKKELRIRLTDINTVNDIGKYTDLKTTKQSKGKKKWKKD